MNTTTPIKKPSRAILRHFEEKDLDTKLKQIFRLSYKAENRGIALILFNKLTNEDKLEFIQRYFRGVACKVAFLEVHSYFDLTPGSFSTGIEFTIWPQINTRRFGYTVARLKDKPTPEEMLRRVQALLPTVKILDYGQDN